MKTFKTLLSEERKIGKKMGTALYVHKDFVGDSAIPSDVHSKALDTLHKEHPDFKHTIVKHDSATGNVSFLHSPDWDTAHEPHIKDSVLVKPDGSTKYMKPKADPQIYHQKWSFVGDNYKGFDVERSKRRTKQYTAAVEHVKKTTGDMKVSSKIGSKSYWEREVVPHIKGE